MERLAQRNCRNRSRPIAVLVAICCLAGSVLAQSAVDGIPDLPTDQDLEFVTVDPELAELVAMLDDAMFAARDKAMQRLLGGPVDRSQICKMLAGTELSAEQRHRLLALLRHDLLNAPRGAIGIMIDQRKAPREIVIEQLIENLPAIEVLEPGDRITHLDGQPLPTWDRFRQSILSKKPGDIVSVTIQRLPADAPDNVADDADEVQLQTLNFKLALGSADLLRVPVTGRVQQIRASSARTSEAEKAVVRFAPQPRRIEFRPQSTAEGEPVSLPTQHGS